MTDSITVDLWAWSLDAEAAEHDRLARLLDDDERARASRFIAEKHQRQFRVGRGRLRELLASYTEVAAAELRFAYGPNGKPSLLTPCTTLHFNLSHTGNLAALAVSRTHELGLDIEFERPIPEDLAGRYFAPAEVDALSRLPAAEFTPAFFRCWSRKEAVVKALGDGLSVPLSSFVVDLREVADAPLLVGPGGTPGADWRILSFRLQPDVAGAVAIKSAGAKVALRRRG